MTSLRVAALAAFLFSMPLAVFAQAPADGGDGGPPAGGPPHGPPPEAIAACQGKAVGTTASFTDPRGHAHTGPCTQMGDVVAVPPPKRPRDGSAPPAANGQ